MAASLLRFDKATGRFEVISAVDLGLEISDVEGLLDALAARVQTVNGVAPDEHGAVVIPGGGTSVADLWFYGG